MRGQANNYRTNGYSSYSICFSAYSNTDATSQSSTDSRRQENRKSSHSQRNHRNRKVRNKKPNVHHRLSNMRKLLIAYGVSPAICLVCLEKFAL